MRILLVFLSAFFLFTSCKTPKKTIVKTPVEKKVKPKNDNVEKYSARLADKNLSKSMNQLLVKLNLDAESEQEFLGIYHDYNDKISTIRNSSDSMEIQSQKVNKLATKRNGLLKEMLNYNQRIIFKEYLNNQS